MTGNRELELASEFCNGTEYPQHTLPEHFCVPNIMEMPGMIPMVIIIAVAVLLVVFWMTWFATMHHIVGNFLDMSERERMEHMLKLAGDVNLRRELEFRDVERKVAEGQSLEQRIAPAGSVSETEASLPSSRAAVPV